MGTKKRSKRQENTEKEKTNFSKTTMVGFYVNDLANQASHARLTQVETFLV